MYSPVPLFPGMPGGIEIFVILLIVVLLFGANKLPKLARSSGQAMGEFQKGREEIEQELHQMRESATKPVSSDDGDAETDDLTADTEARTAVDSEAEREPAAN